MLLLRHGSRLLITPATSRLSFTLIATSQRAYVSKKARHGKGTVDVEQQGTFGEKRGPITTASLTPGSQKVLTDPASQEEYTRALAKMAANVEWFRREVAQLDARVSGRVTPQLLAPVRVPVLGTPRKGEEESSVSPKMRLEDLATVGVRDGSSLIVTVFDPQNLKHVQDALYEAKIQGIIPQRIDERTLKIPIPKLTVEARLAAYSTASKLAEDARVQIRRQLQASVKRGKYSKHSIEHEEFQKLQDRHITEVDTVLAQIKKDTGAR
ncbi:ribosome recycling factor domain-containing protein [Multifurca ochricompacta]|uniref:Ribosome recycling factor domain-containing protein n=1 Tax=Multifurca ochricompacta TaxID=376703 RepID=A0AAD4QQ97_9AGAM|nr:ribosome recycling factor domain-containing protein [Multifurca ochricompacta]